jgi:hypothetical protein
LLVATWNVANLGLQKRTDADHALIAEILRWFDLVAVQDDDLTGLRAVLSKLPKKRRGGIRLPGPAARVRRR